MTRCISDSFLSNSTYQVARQRLQTRKKEEEDLYGKTVSPFDASVRSANAFSFFSTDSQLTFRHASRNFLRDASPYTFRV